MSTAIQNALARAQAAGRTVAEAAAASNIVPTSANIDINGIANSVEGTLEEITLATQEVFPINDLTRSVDAVVAGAGGAFGNTISGMLGSLFAGSMPQANSLEQFASFNYVLTFGCLTSLELNFPDATYRKREPSVIIASTGGGAGANKATTLYETNGRVEYFIDNLQVESLIIPNQKTRQTNATSVEFEVTEPYSMGLFLQTLQVASLRAGHKNYLEAPFIITIDFKGHDDTGRTFTVPRARRMFPFKLADVTFNVNEGGSTYRVSGFPYNEEAFSDSIQTTQTDVTITGSTVSEMLQSGGQSLSVAMNDRSLELLEAGQIKSADQYVIMFPTADSSASENLLGAIQDAGGATTASESDPSAEATRELTDEQKAKLFETISGIQNGDIPADFDAELQKILGIVIKRSDFGETIREYSEKEENINPIGAGKIVKSFLDGGQTPFGKPKFSEVEGQSGVFSRGKVQISDEGRRITFPKGTRIQDVIEEVVLLSDYGRDLAFQEPDTNGMIEWYKLEAQVFDVTSTEQVTQTGKPPRVYVYRVVPYKVHISKLTGATQPAPGIEQLKRQAVKEYNYIYTGKNKDILDFEINFDAAFFNALQPDLGQLNSDQKTGDTNRMAAGTSDAAPTINEGNTEVIPSEGQASTRSNAAVNNNRAVGGAAISPESQVARNFNEAIVNSPTDLVSIDFKIMGDPYYIADSGMGNYNAAPTGMLNINSDGAMNQQSGEVDIIMNFRTPLDYNDNGGMDFPGMGTRPVGAFSGLYTVLTCSNRFSEGQFTQELSCIRRRNQDVQANETAASPAFMTEGDGSNAISPSGNSTTTGSDTSGSTGGTGGQSSESTGDFDPTNPDTQWGRLGQAQ